MPEYSASDSLPSDVFDIVIVGSGVVGCAMARRFAMEGARLLVIEKSGDILDGASKANSAILHTGFDAPPPGSQEHGCLVEGYREYREIHARLNLPLLECGALVLAWSEAEAERLDSLLQNARRNGVSNARIIGTRQVRAREPEVADSVKAALEIPGESVVDPWSAPYAYLLQALENGASLARNCELTGGHFDGEQWRLETSRGHLSTRQVINCAGLYGDRINHMLIGESDFGIRPRKGQFVVYDKSARGLLRSILLPVPTEITKGVVVCPTIFGNLLVGPTAEEQESRSDASVDSGELHALTERGMQILPGLRQHSVTATYAGLRPASEHKDYQIKWYAQQNYCCVGGIRSTGLSAALGIAGLVYRQYRDNGNHHQPAVDCRWPRVARIAETDPRDWQQAGNGGILCHCELVTRREILQALDGPLAPDSLAGLKRRTRAGMGRCQGFYCSAELCQLTEGRMSQALPVARK
jgi:glycerol-3-phosphate dehydrogenase